MSILVPTDFKGSFAITQNKHDAAKLQLYIDENERPLLDDLLGCELAQLLIDDLAAQVADEPTALRFKDIYDPFCKDVDTLIYNLDWPWFNVYYQYYCLHQQNRSRGIKTMLKGFIYFMYVRDQPQLNSSVGVTVSNGAASELVPSTHTNIVRKYNESIVDYWNIQYFINTDITVYPEFHGIKKEPTGII